MRRFLSKIGQSIKYIRRRIPLRLTFFIVLFFIIIVRNYISSGSSEKIADISRLLLKASVFVFVVIVLFSALTILISYLLFRKRGAKPIVKFYYAADNDISCEVTCKDIIFPLAGIVKAELIYDKTYNTTILLKRKKGRMAVGEKALLLPDIKVYELNTVTIFFQDFFRMFSLQKTFRYKSSISILPVSLNKVSVSSMPVTLDNDEIRTDTVHRKEGELLHFKNFESSDDIRRIVWSVYAKTKELIVRIAEMHNMYASKVDLYASFSNSFDNFLDKKISDEFLNKYKTSIWEVYRSLKEENEVNFIPDQNVAETSDISIKISVMQWHKENIETYLGKEKVSVCCISSLVNATDFEKVIETFGMNTLVVFVSLKNYTGSIKLKDIIKEIFTITDENGIKWKWWFSINRKKIVKNEDSLRNLLESSKVNFIEL